MWMEEHLGKRVNLARTEEALATEAKQIATGCPFCRTMLTDGLTEKQNSGEGEGVEVLDVSQLLLASVKRGDPHTNGSKSPAAEPAAEPADEPAEKPAENS
jgi:Fe-S oxidoreductase